MDINDLTIVLANYGRSTGAAAGYVSAVPEPSSLLLAGLCVFGLLAYAWKRRSGGTL